MSQYKDIPLATDQRNVSQNDIRTNFDYLSTPINVAAGIPPGILPVDHLASGDNVANPTDGFHNQVSMLAITPPSNLTNAINGQNSNTITYTKLDGNSNGQLWMLNSFIASPITYLKAYCQFNQNGVLLGNNFNVSSVVRNSNGDFSVNFANNLASLTYGIVISSFSSSGTHVYAYSYGTKTNAGFEMFIYDVIGKNYFNPTETTVLVYGLF